MSDSTGFSTFLLVTAFLTMLFQHSKATIFRQQLRTPMEEFYE